MVLYHYGQAHELFASSLYLLLPAPRQIIQVLLEGGVINDMASTQSGSVKSVANTQVSLTGMIYNKKQLFHLMLSGVVNV